MVKFDKAIIAGDFNIHIDKTSNPYGTDFLNICKSLNLVQHVSGPTHNCGQTLNLVSTLDLSLTSLNMHDFVSDNTFINLIHIL